MIEVYDVNPDFTPEEKDAIENSLGFGKKKIHAKFILTAPLDPTLSAQLGRPIHVDTVSIIEIAEGVRDFISRPATDADKARYPAQWRGFKAALENPQYPIEQLAGAKPCEIAMFRASNIGSIQAAAAITSPHPELADAVLRAKRWMAISAGEKPRIKLEAA